MKPTIFGKTIKNWWKLLSRAKWTHFIEQLFDYFLDSCFFGVGWANSKLRNHITYLQFFSIPLVLIPFYYFIVIFITLLTDSSEYFPSLFLSILNLATICTNGLLTFFYMFLMLKQYLVNIILLTLFSYVQFYKLKAIRGLLLPVLADGKWKNFARFTQLHTRILVEICEANRLFGYTLLADMLASSPFSAYLFILLLCFDQSFLVAVHHTSILLYGWMIILAIHLLAAQYTNRIHECAKPLLRLSAHLQSAHRKDKKAKLHLSVRVRLNLAFYVEKFHCKDRRYGFTFAIFGLISLSSFFKVCVQYNEMILVLSAAIIFLHTHSFSLSTLDCSFSVTKLSIQNKINNFLIETVPAICTIFLYHFVDAFKSIAFLMLITCLFV